MANLPKLVSLIAGEVLFLYVAISKYSLTFILVAERESKKFPIYYISHTYWGSEANNSEIEKVIYVVVTASRKTEATFSVSPDSSKNKPTYKKGIGRKESILQGG